uniref:Uncharacterized protein n=1 Tax=Physcomitrium patens TaxID=3218 RepID=A0A2K1J185_PHYPA|nr:hypothetical protein PHYPA_023187 [Physcomitrium patens]
MSKPYIWCPALTESHASERSDCRVCVLRSKASTQFVWRRSPGRDFKKPIILPRDSLDHSEFRGMANITKPR